MAGLEAIQSCIQLYTAVFETLTLNEAHLARRAGEGFTTTTELADALVREAGLPFRSAHLVRALDSRAFVEARNGLGGVAPSSTGVLLGELTAAQALDQSIVEQKRQRLDEAERVRSAAVLAIS